MKATLIRATGQKIEVNVPPPPPPSVTYRHPHDFMRLETFDLLYRTGVGGKNEAVYRERE